MFVKLEREAAFYNLNYALVVHMFVAFSWNAFLIDLSYVADRVTIALTLVLALNVF